MILKEFQKLSERKKYTFFGACLSGLSVAYLLANHHHLMHQPPEFTNESGRKVLRAPGYKVQQSEFDPTVVQIVNIPATILDTHALIRGRQALIDACGEVKVVPVKGAEDTVWEAKIANANTCLVKPQK